MAMPRCCIGKAAALALLVIPVALAGRQPAANRSPPETQILMLGTAGGPPLRADRSEPATLLIVDGRRYLIDCGIGTARRLVEAGVRSETIDIIFLTHLHADHDLGLADVLANDFQWRDRIPTGHKISIYGPPQTRALVNAAYRYISIPYAVYAAEAGGPRGGVPQAPPFSTHEIGTGVVYADSKIRVIAAENTHYALMPRRFRAVMKSYSYRFETPHGVVVFTGDTGPNEAVVRLAEGADVLVSEVEDFAALDAFIDRMAKENHWSPERRKRFEAHMTAEHLDIKDVGQMATKAHVKSVILYHWYPTDPKSYVAGVRKYFPGAVFASADLQRYCLRGSSRDGTSNRSQLRRCN